MTGNKMKHFETFSTTADVGIRIQGEGYESLLKNAINGINLLLFDNKQFDNSSNPPEIYSFEYSGDGAENILVNLLSEVVFLVQSRNKITRELITKEINYNFIKADLLLAPGIIEPDLEIKSVTYHNLKIIDKPDGTKLAEVVFDV